MILRLPTCGGTGSLISHLRTFWNGILCRSRGRYVKFVYVFIRYVPLIYQGYDGADDLLYLTHQLVE